MSNLVGKKICTKCRQEKPLEEFWRKKIPEDSRASECKSCGKRYREANSEKIAARHKRYREANSEKIAARDKRYREANSEKIAARHKRYNEAHPEKILARHKRYREANSEKIAARDKRYNEAHPEKILARHKRYREILHDVYILKRLGLKKPQVAPQLIEVKRLHLQIFRHLKEAQA